MKITSPYRVRGRQALETLWTSERKSVRGEVTAVGVMKSKQRRKEFMLIENYLIIPRADKFSIKIRWDEAIKLH